MIIRSKFSWNILAPIYHFLAATVFFFVLAAAYATNPEYRCFPVVTLAAFIAMIASILFWLPLRKKAVTIVITDNEIVTRSFLGIGSARRYPLSAFTGFVYFNDRYKDDKFERLYILINDKKIIGISGFYHKNYNQLKQILSQTIPDLGLTTYSRTDELLETFL